MKLNVFIVGWIMIAATNTFAQQAENYIVNGNEFYRQQQYEQAEKQYRQAVSIDPKNEKALFNLGNTLFKLNKADEAKAIFIDLANRNEEPLNRSAAYYNYGVILTKEKKLEESIEAYKNSLRQNPDDKEARENLQKALLEQKKKNPKKQDDKKQKQDQQQKPQSKMSKKEAEQKLKLLEQKEKNAQKRLQKEKAKSGTSLPKDW